MSQSLLKSTSVVGGMTLISRILGFIRDMLMAHIFGASLGYDAFLLAFKIPNFMRRLFAEGAFSQAFVPVLSEYQSQKNPEEMRSLIDKVAGSLGLALILTVGLGIVLAPWIVKGFAPGFTEEGGRLGLASDMLRVTFPYLFFISLTAFSGGVLNTLGRFAVPSVTPVLLNMSLIFSAVCLTPYFDVPIHALAWGVLIGGLLQLGFQVPFLYRNQVMPRPKVDWQDPGVRKILALMFPALLGVSVAQLNALIDTLFASFLPVGSISWLYYADRLMEFPLGVFGVALATVVLPSLSKQHAKLDNQRFSETMDWGIRWVFLVGAPSVLGLFVLSGPLIASLFYRGAFVELDVFNSSHALMAYAVGVLAIMLTKVFASGFYARQDIKTPVRIAVVSLVLNACLNAILIQQYAHVGLALATALAAIVNAALLFWAFRKKGYYQAQVGWTRFLSRLTLACVVMVAFLQGFSPELSEWLTWSMFQRLVTLSIMITGAALIYFATLFAFGMRKNDFLTANQATS